MPVTHACNPSYSGSRNQEDHSSKPAQTNSSRDPISKKPSKKRAGRMAQDIGSEFNPSMQKKKKERKKKERKGSTTKR
jgi:hypothetical protein